MGARHDRRKHHVACEGAVEQSSTAAGLIDRRIAGCRLRLRVLIRQAAFVMADADRDCSVQFSEDATQEQWLLYAHPDPGYSAFSTDTGISSSRFTR
jgi:hypothetical protein